MVSLTRQITFPDRKISDTLLLFAEPLTTALGPNPLESQFRALLALSWLMWNTVVYADVAMNTESLDGLHRTMRSMPDAAKTLEAMIGRKRNLFGDDQRLIGKYELYRKGGEFRLRAEARDPLSKHL